MTGATGVQAYRPLTLVELADLLENADRATRWRLIAEFLEEYRWEPARVRFQLLEGEPAFIGDERWDVLLAALAEHLAARDGLASPTWCQTRHLRRFWFPFNTPAARADAIVHAPAAFRRRGIFLSAHELDVA